MNTKIIVLGVLALLIGSLLFYLLRPLSTIPAPAEFNCLAIEDGIFISVDSLPLPQNIYGMGLTYRQHLLETAAEFDPTSPPPIFRKKRQSLSTNGDPVSIPSPEQMTLAAEDLEKGVGQKLRTDFDNL